MEKQHYVGRGAHEKESIEENRKMAKIKFISS